MLGADESGRSPSSHLVMDGTPVPGCDDDGVPLRLDRPGLSVRFERRRVVLAPGEVLPYEARDWADALVEVLAGTVELVCTSGRCERLAAGSILWLDGVPLRSVRNAGAERAVLLAVARRTCGHPTDDDPARDDDDDAPDPTPRPP